MSIAPTPAAARVSRGSRNYNLPQCQGDIPADMCRLSITVLCVTSFLPSLRPLHIPPRRRERVTAAAVRMRRALRAPPSPAASSAGWPLTPHAGATRVTFPPPSETPRVCSCRALLTCTPSALFLPGRACAMSGIGSIPGAAGGNPVVFFDISIGGHSAGRIKMEVGCDPRP